MSDASANARRHRFFQLKEPGASDRILMLDTQELTIGRSNDSDLKAKYADVSRRHAVIKREGQMFSVQNLSTSSATLVNGKAAQAHALKHQDVIRIGELEITFFESADNPATLGARLEYASQFKDFAPGGVQSSNPEATILGVAHSEGDTGRGEFEVGRAGDFGYGLDALDEASSEPRNLDLELDGFGLHDVLEPVEMTPEALAPRAKPAAQKPLVAQQPPAAAQKSATPAEAWTLDDLGSAPKASRSGSAATASLSGSAATAPRLDSAAKASRSSSAATAPRLDSAATAPRSGSAATASLSGSAATAPRSGSAAMTPRLDGAERASESTLSLNLEIEGLTPDLQNIVGSLIGKVISLPSLKIRLKGKDLG